MKYFFTILILTWFFQSYAQTENDSLIIYNNAVKVLEFYNENPHYKLQSSKELLDISERKEVFEMLNNSRRLYFVLRRALKKMSNNPNYKDITYKEYYSEIDEHRFYQRELENQIVNQNAPFPMYDDRILPVIMNIYINEDSTDTYFGDLVQIPLYVPVVVKPYVLLTDDELQMRNKILHIVPNLQKFDSAKRFVIKRDSLIVIDTNKIVVIDRVNYNQATNVFIYNQYGSGGIIGFMWNRNFYKLKSELWNQYAVPQFARDVIVDNDKLKKLLYQRFGLYFTGNIY